jgi:hypothetical protein
MSGPGLESGPAPAEKGPRDDLIAAGLGTLALAIACVPLLLLVFTPGNAGANIRALPDARQWPGLRWFGLASALGVGPTFVLARRALDRARRWPAKVPATLAIVAGLPMIPGTVIQIAWWTSG